MHNLIVIFVILLVLLMTISTLGGSVYAKETFDQTKVREMFWDSNSGNPTPEPTMTAAPPVEDSTEHFYTTTTDAAPMYKPGAPHTQSNHHTGHTGDPVAQKELDHPATHKNDVIEGFDGAEWALAN